MIPDVTTLIVVGNILNRPTNSVDVPGLGKATIKITFTDYKITQIVFNRERPNLTGSAKKYSSPASDQQRCHIEGWASIKEKIQQQYEGQDAALTPDPLRYWKNETPEGKLARCRKETAKKIGDEALKMFRAPKNIFLGKKEFNNFTGKISWLLSPWVKRQKELQFPLEIPIPHAKGTDKKFGASLKEYFPNGYLIIQSEEKLGELYRFVNNQTSTDLTIEDFLSRYYGDSSTSSSSSSTSTSISTRSSSNNARPRGQASPKATSSLKLTRFFRKRSFENNPSDIPPSLNAHSPQEASQAPVEPKKEKRPRLDE
ncbi:hypothetical protein PARA125_000349 [Parachlamydia sp. AcF125]|nr:hypothetical protein [Parachlamydia sp. AcF125]